MMFYMGRMGFLTGVARPITAWLCVTWLLHMAASFRRKPLGQVTALAITATHRFASLCIAAAYAAKTSLPAHETDAVLRLLRSLPLMEVIISITCPVLPPLPLWFDVASGVINVFGVLVACTVKDQNEGPVTQRLSSHVMILCGLWSLSTLMCASSSAVQRRRVPVERQQQRACRAPSHLRRGQRPLSSELADGIRSREGEETLQESGPAAHLGGGSCPGDPPPASVTAAVAPAQSQTRLRAVPITASSRAALPTPSLSVPAAVGGAAPAVAPEGGSRPSDHASLGLPVVEGRTAPPRVRTGVRHSNVHNPGSGGDPDPTQTALAIAEPQRPPSLPAPAGRTAAPPPYTPFNRSLAALALGTPASGLAPRRAPPPHPGTSSPVSASALAPPGAYRPFLRHHVTHVKLRGVQPSMISPGYEQRLRELVATRTGRRVSHVYVRAGCIELVMDCEEWGSGLLSGSLGQGSSPGQGSPVGSPLASRAPRAVWGYSVEGAGTGMQEDGGVGPAEDAGLTGEVPGEDAAGRAGTGEGNGASGLRSSVAATGLAARMLGASRSGNSRLSARQPRGSNDSIISFGAGDEADGAPSPFRSETAGQAVGQWAPVGPSALTAQVPRQAVSSESRRIDRPGTQTVSANVTGLEVDPWEVVRALQLQGQPHGGAAAAAAVGLRMGAAGATPETRAGGPPFGAVAGHSFLTCTAPTAQDPVVPMAVPEVAGGRGEGGTGAVPALDLSRSPASESSASLASEGAAVVALARALAAAVGDGVAAADASGAASQTLFVNGHATTRPLCDISTQASDVSSGVPRITHLEPRVVAVAVGGGDGDDHHWVSTAGGRQRNAGGGGERMQLFLTFKVVVRGGPSGTSGSSGGALRPGGPWELLVRSEGRYLPAVVTAATATSINSTPATTLAGTATTTTTAASPAITTASATTAVVPGGGDIDAVAGAGSDVDGRTTYTIDLLHPAPSAREASSAATATAAPHPPPLRPGIVLVDLRVGGEPVHAAPVVVLRDADVAAELRAALAAPGLSADDRDSLLMDMGTWVFHAAEALEARRAPAPTAQATRQPQQQRLQQPGQHVLDRGTGRGGGGVGGVGGGGRNRGRQIGNVHRPQMATRMTTAAAGPVAGAPPPPPPASQHPQQQRQQQQHPMEERLVLLGRHLLHYARAAGWATTAAAIQADLAAIMGAPTAPPPPPPPAALPPVPPPIAQSAAAALPPPQLAGGVRAAAASQAPITAEMASEAPPAAVAATSAAVAAVAAGAPRSGARQWQQPRGSASSGGAAGGGAAAARAVPEVVVVAASSVAAYRARNISAAATISGTPAATSAGARAVTALAGGAAPPAVAARSLLLRIPFPLGREEGRPTGRNGAGAPQEQPGAGGFTYHTAVMGARSHHNAGVRAQAHKGSGSKDRCSGSNSCGQGGCSTGGGTSTTLRLRTGGSRVGPAGHSSSGGSGSTCSGGDVLSDLAAAACGKGGGGRSGRSWYRAVLLELGLRRLGSGHEAAYRAYAEPRISALAHVMMAMDVLALGMVACHLHHDPTLLRDNISTLAACWVGAVEGLLRLACPKRVWMRLQKTTKLLRYGSYLAIKGLVGWGAVPLPLGVTKYVTGVGMLVQEGLVHPVAGLLPAPLVALLSCLRLVVNTSILMRVAPTAGVMRIFVWPLLVSCLEVATTVTFHVYLRVSYSRWGPPAKTA